MSQQKDLRKLAVLGSTGSIGRATLDVVRHASGRMKVVALSAHTNLQLLAAQVREFRPEIIVVTGLTHSAELAELHIAAKQVKSEVLFGADALCDVVTRDDIDIVVSAIVGSAGLKSTLSAVEAGKTVALANKESLVVGGELVTQAALKSGGKIIPIDSEHSAILQCLDAGNRDEVTKIILTASGGPFRDWSRQELERVTVADALAHPTWSMGKKITVDSATLMNKALEIIEARWLFDMPPEKNSGSPCSQNSGSQCSQNCGSHCSLRIVLHPQSIVHSMVEFVDGAVMAQLSPPDMRLPIQWAIDYPNRFPSPARRIDWDTMMTLEFFPPDFERFPALRLGQEVAAAGGTAGAVLNAVNEVAVEAFLQEKLPFHQITTVCQSILQHHHHEPRPTFAQLMAADRWARLETQKWVIQ
ncbi:MAG: 1-deoxy-D-xylulose-5-phosphate reductoisomerase [Planctomycetaceae bacterium]|nr:1-deoxy-D-xylulose-5-phosphate reductoisomerase [Planctomycetaceae bacterium]